VVFLPRSDRRAPEFAGRERKTDAVHRSTVAEASKKPYDFDRGSVHVGSRAMSDLPNFVRPSAMSDASYYPNGAGQ
jgi:hypothetical protein